MKLEKKLCKVFKDILESRETNRIFINPFALKQNAREISDLAIKDEYKSFNSSYKMIIYNLQSGNKNNIPMQILAKPAEKTSKIEEETSKKIVKPQDGPLINKQYYCLQYGNETAIRFSSTALPNHKKLFSSNPIKKKGEDAPSKKKQDMVKLPYFLNGHNKQEERLFKLLNQKSSIKQCVKIKKQNIYSLLASSNANIQRKEGEPVKVSKKNSNFQSIKKLLSKTEDEKHEIDVRILQFQMVIRMLTQIHEIYEDEKLKEDTSSRLELENQETVPKVGEEEKVKESDSAEELKDGIQVQTGKEIQGANSGKSNKERVKALYEKYFKAKILKIRENDSNNRERVLYNKIKNLNVLNLIYDNHKRKKIKILEVLAAHRNSKMVSQVKKRVIQKLQVLVKMKSTYSKTTWKENLMNNFYKILDVRSGNLQQNEKNYLMPKYFINSLIEMEKKIIASEQGRFWKRILQVEQTMPVINESNMEKGLDNQQNVKGVFREDTQKIGSSQKMEKEESSNFKFNKSEKKNAKIESDEENNMYDSFVKCESGNFSVNASNLIHENKISDVRVEEKTKKLEEEVKVKEILETNIKFELDCKEDHKKEDVKIIEEKILSQLVPNKKFIQREMVFTNSLMKLLHQEEKFTHKLRYPFEEARFVNPIKIFSMKDYYVIKDAIFFVKLFITFGKINQDRDTNKFLVDSILGNFFAGTTLETPQEENASNLFSSLLNISDIQEESFCHKLIQLIQKFERKIKPDKEYYLSEKMNFNKFKFAVANWEKLRKFLDDLLQNKEYNASRQLAKIRQFKPQEKEIETSNNFKDSSSRFASNNNNQGVPSMWQEQSLPKSSKNPPKRNLKDEEEGSPSKWSISQKKDSFSERKVSRKVEEGESHKANSRSRSSSKETSKRKNIKNQFNEVINNSTTDMNLGKDISLETNIRIICDAKKRNINRSFFGYYNFHNFFNHFLILYERLKFMKSLSKDQEVYEFLKQVMILNICNFIETELFEDIMGCLLENFSGFFLNLEKILININKEIPNQEIDRHVISLNKDLFNSKSSLVEETKQVKIQQEAKKSKMNLEIEESCLASKNSQKEFKADFKVNALGFPICENQEKLLFAKTCHRLSCLTYKNKSNNKQSQIQSYINNNNLVNDHLLKFEFRAQENIFVIHKIKSLYEQGLKQNLKSSLSTFVKNSQKFLNNPTYSDISYFAQLPKSYLATLENSPMNITKKNETTNDENKIEEERSFIPIKEDSLKLEDEEESIFRKGFSVNLSNMKEQLGKQMFIRNEILHEYLLKYNEMKLFESRKEDKLFASKQKRSNQLRKQIRRNQLKKSVKFRNFLEMNLHPNK